LEWSSHPNGQTICFEKIDLAVGGGRSPPRAGVASSTPIRLVWGGRSHPHGPWGWIGHPQQPNQIFLEKKIVWSVGGGPATSRAISKTTKKKKIIFYFFQILSDIFFYFFIR
jgi:hypothetical protein